MGFFSKIEAFFDEAIRQKAHTQPPVSVYQVAPGATEADDITRVEQVRQQTGIYMSTQVNDAIAPAAVMPKLKGQTTDSTFLPHFFVSNMIKQGRVLSAVTTYAQLAMVVGGIAIPFFGPSLALTLPGLLGMGFGAMSAYFTLLARGWIGARVSRGMRIIEMDQAIAKNQGAVRQALPLVGGAAIAKKISALVDTDHRFRGVVSVAQGHVTFLPRIMTDEMKTKLIDCFPKRGSGYFGTMLTKVLSWVSLDWIMSVSSNTKTGIRPSLSLAKGLERLLGWGVQNTSAIYIERTQRFITMLNYQYMHDIETDYLVEQLKAKGVAEDKIQKKIAEYIAKGVFEKRDLDEKNDMRVLSRVIPLGTDTVAGLKNVDTHFKAAMQELAKDLGLAADAIEDIFNPRNYFHLTGYAEKLKRSIESPLHEPPSLSNLGDYYTKTLQSTIEQFSTSPIAQNYVVLNDARNENALKTMGAAINMNTQFWSFLSMKEHVASTVKDKLKEDIDLLAIDLSTPKREDWVSQRIDEVLHEVFDNPAQIEKMGDIINSLGLKTDSSTHTMYAMLSPENVQQMYLRAAASGVVKPQEVKVFINYYAFKMGEHLLKKEITAITHRAFLRGSLTPQEEALLISLLDDVYGSAAYEKRRAHEKAIGRPTGTHKAGLAKADIASLVKTFSAKISVVRNDVAQQKSRDMYGNKNLQQTGRPSYEARPSVVSLQTGVVLPLEQYEQSLAAAQELLIKRRGGDVGAYNEMGVLSPWIVNKPGSKGIDTMMLKTIEERLRNDYGIHNQQVVANLTRIVLAEINTVFTREKTIQDRVSAITKACGPVADKDAVYASQYFYESQVQEALRNVQSHFATQMAQEKFVFQQEVSFNNKSKADAARRDALEKFAQANSALIQLDKKKNELAKYTTYTISWSAAFTPEQVADWSKNEDFKKIIPLLSWLVEQHQAGQKLFEKVAQDHQAVMIDCTRVALSESREKAVQTADGIATWVGGKVREHVTQSQKVHDLSAKQYAPIMPMLQAVQSDTTAYQAALAAANAQGIKGDISAIDALISGAIQTKNGPIGLAWNMSYGQVGESLWNFIESKIDSFDTHSWRQVNWTFYDGRGEKTVIARPENLVLADLAKTPDRAAYKLVLKAYIDQKIAMHQAQEQVRPLLMNYFLSDGGSRDIPAIEFMVNKLLTNSTILTGFLTTNTLALGSLADFIENSIGSDLAVTKDALLPLLKANDLLSNIAAAAETGIAKNSDKDVVAKPLYAYFDKLLNPRGNKGNGNNVSQHGAFISQELQTLVRDVVDMQNDWEFTMEKKPESFAATWEWYRDTVRRIDSSIPKGYPLQFAEYGRMYNYDEVMRPLLAFMDSYGLKSWAELQDRLFKAQAANSTEWKSFQDKLRDAQNTLAMEYAKVGFETPQWLTADELCLFVLKSEPSFKFKIKNKFTYTPADKDNAFANYSTFKSFRLWKPNIFKNSKNYGKATANKFDVTDSPNQILVRGYESKDGVGVPQTSGGRSFTYAIVAKSESPMHNFQTTGCDNDNREPAATQALRRFVINKTQESVAGVISNWFDTRLQYKERNFLVKNHKLVAYPKVSDVSPNGKSYIESTQQTIMSTFRGRFMKRMITWKSSKIRTAFGVFAALATTVAPAVGIGMVLGIALPGLGSLALIAAGFLAWQGLPIPVRIPVTLPWTGRMEMRLNLRSWLGAFIGAPLALAAYKVLGLFASDKGRISNMRLGMQKPYFSDLLRAMICRKMHMHFNRDLSVLEIFAIEDANMGFSLVTSGRGGRGEEQSSIVSPKESDKRTFFGQFSRWYGGALPTIKRLLGDIGANYMRQYRQTFYDHHTERRAIPLLEQALEKKNPLLGIVGVVEAAIHSADAVLRTVFYNLAELSEKLFPALGLADLLSNINLFTFAFAGYSWMYLSPAFAVILGAVGILNFAYTMETLNKSNEYKGITPGNTLLTEAMNGLCTTSIFGYVMEKIYQRNLYDEFNMTKPPYIPSVTFAGATPRRHAFERHMWKHGLLTTVITQAYRVVYQGPAVGNALVQKLWAAPRALLIATGPVFLLGSWLAKEIDRTIMVVASFFTGMAARRILHGFAILAPFRHVAYRWSRFDVGRPVRRWIGQTLRFYVGEQRSIQNSSSAILKRLFSKNKEDGLINNKAQDVFEPPQFIRSQSRWAAFGLVSMGASIAALIAGGPLAGLLGVMFTGIGGANLGAWVVLFWSAQVVRNNLLKISALDLAAGTEPDTEEKKLAQFKDS